MMERYSARQQRIIDRLAQATKPITGTTLASYLGCSLRTVQGEVARINKTSSLITSSNTGYAINRSLLDRLTVSTEPTDTSISHGALQALMLDGSRHRIDDLSEALFVSTATLERHLRTLSPTLALYDLTLMRQGGWLWISGAEADKRRLIASLIATEANGSFFDASQSSSFFNDMDISVVNSLVVSTVETNGMRIRNGYEENLLASIAIALYRIRKGAMVQDDEGGHADGPGSDEMGLAQEICRRYSEHFVINPSPDDIVYLACLLRGQIERRTDSNLSAVPTNTHMAETDEFVRTIEGLVNEVLELFLLRVDVSQSLYNFAMHVSALLHRTQESQIQDDYVLDNVKRRLPFVYEISLLVADKLSRYFDIKISSGEIGFICIHMGMLLEATMDEECVRVALVSRDYRGIAANIHAGILDRFAGLVTVTDVAASEIIEGQRSFDLVVTTQRVQAPGLRIVEVSPFFTASDVLMVERSISACMKEKQASRTRRLLGTFLDEQLFFKTDAFRDKQSVIAFLSSKLQKNGIVDKAFADSVLRREELSSTCFFNLFAIPHAIELNARRTMLAVLLSEEGIIWDNVRIHVVLMIAVQQADRSRFMEIYDSVVKSLWSEERITHIMSAQSLEEFLDLIAMS